MGCRPYTVARLKKPSFTFPVVLSSVTSEAHQREKPSAAATRGCTSCGAASIWIECLMSGIFPASPFQRECIGRRAFAPARTPALLPRGSIELFRQPALAPLREEIVEMPDWRERIDAAVMPGRARH